MAKILIVDDDIFIGKMLQITLGFSGHEVIIAPDGQSGLEKASKEKPDIIITDVYHPGPDGYEICRRLKEAEETKDIPVVFLTALNNRRDMELMTRLGAFAFIPKPFEIEELVNIITRIEEDYGLKEKERLYAEELLGKKDWDGLRKTGKPAVIALCSVLEDKNWYIRMKAIDTLGKIGDERAIEPLCRALKDKKACIRVKAAKALKKLGYKRSVMPLLPFSGTYSERALMGYNFFSNKNTKLYRDMVELIIEHEGKISGENRSLLNIKSKELKLSPFKTEILEKQIKKEVDILKKARFIILMAYSNRYLNKVKNV